MGKALGFVRGRGWKVSAVAVGVLAVGVWAAATVVLGSETLLPPLAVAVGFIAVVTVVLIPRSDRRRRHRAATDTTD